MTPTPHIHQRRQGLCLAEWGASVMDRELIQWCDGLFVGQLTPGELEAFDRLCRAGEARRSYDGIGGVMGMAKVKLLPDLGRVPSIRDEGESRG